MDLSSLVDLVKDNVIVQWVLVVSVVLTVGSNTATKLKGPIGVVARWGQNLGERRVNREATERRKVRQRVSDRITSLQQELDEVYADRDALARMVRMHMGWDYDRMQQLINQGVRPGDIPTPPPLRTPFSPRTDTLAMKEVREAAEAPRREAQPATD